MESLLKIKNQFPALTQQVNNHSFVYLDSAATTLKPEVVIESIKNFYNFETFNVHRGAHFLGQKVTQKFEDSREVIRTFLNAKSEDEIIFTKGTTEGLNLLASSLSEKNFKKDDVILLTEMEHHANIVPWQVIAQRLGLNIQYIKILPDGALDLLDLEQKLSQFKPKLVSFTACSNVLGTVNDTKKIIEMSQAAGALTVVDAAQIVTHEAIDVQKLNCDFLVFSAHKLFGPTGFGVLYGKKDLLNELPPYQFGGSMIVEVLPNHSTWNVLPFKFEAGTPHVEGAIATAAAIRFVSQVGFEKIHAHKSKLNELIQKRLQADDELEVYGTTLNKTPVYSFNLKGTHHSDVAQILDQQGIAVRAGHHCAQPLLRKFNITGSVRASFSIYNDENDVDLFFKALQKAKDLLL